MKRLKNGITELVFILDRSGSMSGLESDTIGGFNAMIEKQRKQDGECYVSTVLFDDVSEVLHDRVKLSEIKPMCQCRCDVYIYLKVMGRKDRWVYQQRWTELFSKP